MSTSLRIAMMTLIIVAKSSALSLSQTPPPSKPSTEKDRLKLEIKQLSEAGQWAEAIVKAEAILTLDRRTFGEDSIEVANSLNAIARLQASREDWKAARDSATQVLTMQVRRYGEADWRTTDARLYVRSLDRKSRMKPSELAALKEAESLEVEVRTLQRSKKFGQAILLARRVVALQSSVLGGEDYDCASALNQLGTLLAGQSEYPEARRTFEGVVAINRQFLGEGHPYYASALQNLAQVLRSTRDFAAAKALQEQCLAIRTKVLGRLHVKTVDVVDAIAFLEVDMGHYEAARSHFEDALSRHREAGRERSVEAIDSLHYLGFLFYKRGDYSSARPLLEREVALRLEVQGERSDAYTGAVNGLATVLYQLEDFSAARPLYEKVVRLREATQGFSYALALDNLALVLTEQKEYDAAQPMFEQAQAIIKAERGDRDPDYIQCFNNQAKLLLMKGDNSAATRILERSLALHEEIGEQRDPSYTVSLSNLAYVRCMQGDLATSRGLYERAIEIRREILGERHPQYIHNLAELSSVRHTQGDPIAAEALAARSLDLASEAVNILAAGQTERQQLITAGRLRSSLDAYLSVAPEAGAPVDRSYTAVLGWKGAVLRRQMNLRDPRPDVAELARTLRETSRTLATLALSSPRDDARRADWRRDVEALAETRERQERDLAARSPTFRRDRETVRRGPEAVRAALPPGVALIDFLEYLDKGPTLGTPGRVQQERRVAAFVVRRDQPVGRVDLGPLAPITEAVDRWRGGLSDPQSSTNVNSVSLRDRIWRPIEPLLDGVSTVLYSPDGVLCRVPLAALPGRKAGSYLIEDYAFAVVPIPQRLGDSRPEASSPDGLLLVGNVDFDGEPGAAGESGSRVAATPSRSSEFGRFEALPASFDEINAVAGWFEEHAPSARGTKLTRGNATEERFRREAPGRRYLHLATHGYFAPSGLRSALGANSSGVSDGKGAVGSNPGLLSGIAMAGANRRPPDPGRDDGILTAMEVADLDLSACELAVLSACETGLGEPAGGEGLLGLQRAFQVAGARAVVASLWKVGDEPTRALMARFYENLWAGGLAKVEALRRAQLAILKDPRGRGLNPVVGPESSARTPPILWAGFVLSGDGLEVPAEGGRGPR